MLRVIIEYHPFGIEAGKQVIGEVRIGNDGSGSQVVGNYDITLASKSFLGDRHLTGRVEGFRRRDHDAADLLYLALDALLRGDRLAPNVATDDSEAFRASNLGFALGCAALRYALPRHSAAGGIVADAIRAHLPLFHIHELRRMSDETDEGGRNNDPIDAGTWFWLHQDIKAEIERRIAAQEQGVGAR